MQDVPASYAKIWEFLGFLATKSKDLLWFVSMILENLAKFCAPSQKWIPRSWQGMSKIQDFSWQKIQETRLWAIPQSKDFRKGFKVPWRRNDLLGHIENLNLKCKKNLRISTRKISNVCWGSLCHICETQLFNIHWCHDVPSRNLIAIPTYQQYHG